MKRLLTSFAFLICSIIIMAQPTWKNITDTRYVSKIVPDGNKIWLASAGGLICIDRVTSDTLFYNNANSGMPFTEINDMCFDKQGRLWVVSNWAGIACKDGDIWTSYNTTTTSLPNNRALTIACDSQGNIWVGLLNNLAKFDGTNWTTFSLASIGLMFNYSGVIAIDANDRVLMSGNGLWAFDGTSFIKYDTSNSPILSNGINSIKTFPDGKTWIGHYFRGLTITDFSNWSVYDTLVPGKELSDVNSFDRTIDGKYWLSTYHDLYYFDGTNWNQRFAEAPADSLNYFSCLAVDNENNLFVCADKNAMYDGTNWSNFNTAESPFMINQVDDIFHASDNSTWIANFYGMSRYSNNEWSLYNHDDSSFVSPTCYAEDHYGNLYAGHYAGISEFKNNVWNRVNIPSDNLFSAHANNICFDLNNNLWVASIPGVIKFDGINATYYSPYYNNFPDYEVFCLKNDNNGNLIAGINGGIVIWNGTNWVLKQIPNPPVTDDKVWDITVHGNNIWLATSGGLVRFDGTNWEFFTPGNSPLPESYIPTIDSDSNGVLWMISGINNLVKFDGQNWQILGYYETGMNYGHQRTLRIDNLGNVWLGGFDCAISIFNENGIYLDAPDISQLLQSQQIIKLVYPNPTKGEIKISYKLPDDRPCYTIAITDLQGKHIDSFSLTTQNGICNYSAGKLVPGQYYISIRNRNIAIATSKVLVIH